MDADSWSGRLFSSSSSSSKRYQSVFQSRSDLFLGHEEIAGDEDYYPCPFCLENFDAIGLCCHIDDEHPVEAKNGVCPVCAMRVGVNMVAHIILQHGNFFKVQRRRKFRKGGSHATTLSLLKKELREGNLQSLFGGSSSVVSSSSAAPAPDPLLTSFIYNLPIADELESLQLHSSAETNAVKKSTNENLSERNAQPSPLSDKNQEEKAKKSEFVQGLLLSTIFNDTL